MIHTQVKYQKFTARQTHLIGKTCLCRSRKIYNSRTWYVDQSVSVHTHTWNIYFFNQSIKKQTGKCLFLLTCMRYHLLSKSRVTEAAMFFSRLPLPQCDLTPVKHDWRARTLHRQRLIQPVIPGPRGAHNFAWLWHSANSTRAVSE